MNSFFVRIYSQLYKNLLGLLKNNFRLSDVLLWPLLYLFTLSFFSSYVGIKKDYFDVIILGMMGWRAVYFMSQELVASYMEDHWSKSLAFLHISPLSRLEFALSSSLSGFSKVVFVLSLYLLVTGFLYSFSIVHLDLFLLGMFFLIFLGFSFGLIILGITYLAKESAFNISFLLPDFVVLMSGVYFSVDSVFPSFVLPFIKLLPTTQAFNVLKSASDVSFSYDLTYLFVSSIVFFFLCERINFYLYNKARKQGKLGRFG
ncbi:ABC transporter permease [Candidatus Micrarchaeota archaeon]|nr:ABC transporter permease [Candidatus Micrarchaeota archaeon]